MTRFEWLKLQIELLRKHPQSECVEWPYTRITKGYGQVWDEKEKKQWLVHRLAYQLFNDQVPQYLVCHRCDNPSCFNPIHLYDGTPEDNMADMVRRHRDNGGDKKLTETHVQEIIDLIRNTNMTFSEIGKRFGITHPTISAINTGRAWKHIPRRIPLRNQHVVRPGKTTILNEQECREISRLLNNNITQKEIAAQFGVSQTNISAIKRGKIRSFQNIISPSLHDDRYKLTERDVVEIIELLENGEKTTPELAQRFGVSNGTIGAIKYGGTWKHVPRPTDWPRQKKMPPDKGRVLSKDQVIQIIALLDSGLGQRKIAKQFGVSRWTIMDIRRGRTWKHIPRPYSTIFLPHVTEMSVDSNEISKIVCYNENVPPQKSGVLRVA